MSAVVAGGTWLKKGQPVQALVMTVTYKGAQVDVEYIQEGCFMPATATDAAEYPTAKVLAAEIGGMNVNGLVDFDELADLVEAELRR